jgi:hypothetical protein
MSTDPTLHHRAHALPWDLPAAPTNDRARRDAIPAPVSDDVHRIPTVTRRAATTGPDPALLRVVDSVCESIAHRAAVSPPVVLHSAIGREVVRAAVVDGVTAASGEIYCDLHEEIDRLRAEVRGLRRRADERGTAIDSLCSAATRSDAEIARLRGYLVSACEIMTATTTLDMLPSSRIAMVDAIAIMRGAAGQDPDCTRRG